MGEEAGKDKRFDPKRSGIFPAVEDKGRYGGCIVIVVGLGTLALITLGVIGILYARRVLG